MEENLTLEDSKILENVGNYAIIAFVDHVIFFPINSDLIGGLMCNFAMAIKITNDKILYINYSKIHKYIDEHNLVQNIKDKKLTTTLYDAVYCKYFFIKEILHCGKISDKIIDELCKMEQE